MGAVPAPGLNFAGIFYTWSLLGNLMVQGIAVCFAIACVVALLKNPPACLVGGNLAAWSLYSALFAFAIPACMGLFITCGYWSARPEKSREAFMAAGAVILHAAIFTSPTLIIGGAAWIGSRYRLRSVPRGPSPTLWYGSSGTLVSMMLLMPIFLLVLGFLSGLLLIWR